MTTLLGTVALVALLAVIIQLRIGRWVVSPWFVLPVPIACLTTGLLLHAQLRNDLLHRGETELSLMVFRGDSFLIQALVLSEATLAAMAQLGKGRGAERRHPGEQSNQRSPSP